MRECPLPGFGICDSPLQAADYFRQHVESHPYYNPNVECLVALLLNTRRRPLGHMLISIGTLNSLNVHPREVFRPAIAAAAYGLIIAHNHPSGDPTPSQDDIAVTKNLIHAGQVLKIELLDHLVMGRPSSEHPLGYTSMRELGYFHL